MNLGDWRKALKLWAPPLIGIPAMLLLGYWFEIARFFLFAHHLFWIVGGFLLINPVIETFWPSAKEEKRQPLSPQPSAKARRRAKERKRAAKQKPTPVSETPTERLARLQKQKEAVDQQIQHLTAKENKHLK